MNLSVEYVHHRDYTKRYGASDRDFSEGSIQLKAGDAVLIEQTVIVDRSQARSEEAYQQEALENGSQLIANWFSRVDRMIEKLENL